MNKTLSAILVILGFCASSLAADKNKTVSFPRCEGLDASAVAASVKQDYLQKQVLQWKDDQVILGQQRPVVWVNLREPVKKVIMSSLCILPQEGRKLIFSIWCMLIVRTEKPPGSARDKRPYFTNRH